MSALQRELVLRQQQFAGMPTAHNAANPSDIYCDLVVLKEEFEALDYDFRGRQLSVTTLPIVLQGVPLGPFQIRLHWNQIAQGDTPAYRVIAKEPFPAESRDNVTHPHVMDEILCEGEGRHAIRQALVQGRLLDFFLLVAGVLKTYNAESPFVELSVWRSTTCADCGACVDDEYGCSCHQCDVTMCGECEAMCGACERTYCSECTGTCAACHEVCCHGCLKVCAGCECRLCPTCLNSSERCSNCHEEELTENTICTTETDQAAVQPHGLGQATVSA
jgi:hypothetical protein